MLESFRSTLAARARRVLERPHRAAVLVPLVDDTAGLELLLTRRTDSLPTHAGHVAFPGGHVDPGDAGPVEAALREAEEEIGLPPSRVEILGLLDDFPTLHDDTAVTPVVGHIAELPPLTPEPGEVARIFTIPFDLLRDPSAWRIQEMERGGVRWPVYFFDHAGETLWGLSAYILLHLMDLTPVGAPFALPAPRVR